MRQMAPQNETLLNFLQFSLLQHAWSELEVLLFLKRSLFTKQKIDQNWQIDVDLTEKIGTFLIVCSLENRYFHGYFANIG